MKRKKAAGNLWQALLLAAQLPQGAEWATQARLSPGGKGGAEDKIEAMKMAGIVVARESLRALAKRFWPRSTRNMGAADMTLRARIRC